MNLKSKLKIHLKPIEKYVLKPNKLSKQNYFLYVKTYLTHDWNQKPTMKGRCQKLLVFWKTYLKPTFIVWNMKINAH